MKIAQNSTGQMVVDGLTEFEVANVNDANEVRQILGLSTS
jgi:hypothetical protein